MLSFQVMISLLAVILTFTGYGFYIFDIAKGKTEPHLFTWLVLTVLGFTIYSLQILGGGGVGTWSLLVGCFLALVVLLMSFWKGTKDVTSSDILFLFLSGVALMLWLVIDQPIWSAILVTAIEIFGFIPTVRKSWNNPYSETLLMYQISAIRFGLSIFALQNFNILTTLYPAVWLLINILFTVLLIVRRKMIDRQ